MKVMFELDKLKTTPLRVVVSYTYLVFSQPPACLHQAMKTRKPFYISSGTFYFLCNYSNLETLLIY